MKPETVEVIQKNILLLLKNTMESERGWKYGVRRIDF